ncbi:MAG TPA: hypothetical protein VLB76_02590 [Thermoanaerobaculia bacterium]|jgi:hypothetical protein|nr:hypothetical protein [Thermoanaerobaculia bacterium]
MSQQIRRVLVALGLMAALFLTTPAPSQAAGLRNALPVNDLAARLWAWVEGLLPGAAALSPASPKPVAGLQKQGSMIDPNGQQVSSPSPPPTPSATSDQGSAIDPNGAK